MKKSLKNLVIGAVVATVLTLSTLTVAPVCAASDIATQACNVDPSAAICADINNDSQLTTMATNIINTALMVVGVLAVAMIIFSGISYVTSAGDNAKTTKAKNTLIYSIVGLAVAISAYAIVNFVLSKL